MHIYIIQAAQPQGQLKASRLNCSLKRRSTKVTMGAGRELGPRSAKETCSFTSKHSSQASLSAFREEALHHEVDNSTDSYVQPPLL